MAVIKGTANADTLVGTADKDTITGAAGNDTITGAGGNDVVRMGAGDDLFVRIPAEGDDKVDGQDGFDTFRFTGSIGDEHLWIQANAGWARFERNNDLNVVELDNVERIHLRTLTGVDVIDISDLSTTDVQQVVIDLAGTVGGTTGDGALDSVSRFGTTGNDTVTVALVGGKVAVTGLSAQLTISHADAFDQLEVSGNKGNDIINASTLAAGVMTLILSGDEGNDRLIGGKGNDFLYGGIGNDTVAGGAGNDLVSLGTGNDLFVWNPGDGGDTVDGGAGYDILRFTGSNADEVIYLDWSVGNTFLYRNIGSVFLHTDLVERIEVRALGGTDSITVRDIADTDVAEVAIDLAATAGGILADKMGDTVAINGNAFDDIIDVSWSGTEVIATRSNYSVGANYSVSIAHADATDVLVIDGGGGKDTLVASGLAAGKMSLLLLGGDGDDVLFGSAGIDLVRGGDGNDIAFLGVGNDVFFWDVGDDSDTIDGQAGFDTLNFQCSGASDTINITGVGGRVQLVRDAPTTVTDTMDLNRVEQIRIRSNGAYDNIAVDTQTLAVTHLKQVAVDSHGALGGTVDVTGTSDNNQITVTTYGGLISLTGLPVLVTIVRPATDEYLAINGAEGDDNINAVGLTPGIIGFVADGGLGNDTIIGSAGKDTLRGGTEKDIVRGGAGSDALFGDAGNDVLVGGVGDDTLTGGAGNDTITAGGGNDIVQYTSVLDGNDVILDFDGNPTGGQDVVDLDLLFDSLGVAAVDRAGRVSVFSSAGTVNVLVNADGNAGNGFEVTITLHTSDAITVGQDVLVGS